MDWLKTIRGESRKSSQEILQEIQGVDGQISDMEIQAKALRDEIKAAGIERLAGGGSDKTITKLETELKALERDAALLADVRAALVEKQDQALTAEKSKRVVEIDRIIDDLRTERAEMQGEAVSLAAHLAALLYRTQGTHITEIKALLKMDHAQGVQFRSEVEKITGNQKPLQSLERELMAEKTELTRR